MLSTAIGVQFNVNDLGANYEVVGTSDNYSFQYNIGKGSDLVDFEGEATQKIISLEGNYGLFDVRVFASSDIGTRSEFVESGISISAPNFDDTFTFANLKIDNLPENVNIGAFNIHEPNFPGDKLEVQAEYINRNVEISWGLVPPVGHTNEGSVLTTELLRDTFFEKFEIKLRNGTGSHLINNTTLAESVGMQQTLSTADVTGLLNEYREFSLTLNQASFDDIDFDRTLSVEIVSHDSFGRTATGTLTGVNYGPQVEGLTSSLRGSDMSFSWFSDDTDFSGVNIKSLAIPSSEKLIYPSDIDASIEHYLNKSSASAWNFGLGEYRSGDMVYYDDLVYQAKKNLTLELIESVGRHNSSPTNSQFWTGIGAKIPYYSRDLEVFGDTSSNSQVWGYSYYYSFQPKDGYGEVETLNLTEEGLIESGVLRPHTSEVRIGNLRFRERKDDFVFNWEVLDQDSNLVDLDQYKFSLSLADIPSVLGISGSLFDSNTKNFVTGITEGNNSRASSVDSFGNRQVQFDLPNAKIFDSYEFTREINNQIYGTGGFLSDFELFNTGIVYYGPSPEYVEVLGEGESIYTCLEQTNNYNPQVAGHNPTIRPSYNAWNPATTYPKDDVVSYIQDLYVLTQEFGPEASDVVGVFDSRKGYSVGELVIGPDVGIFPYFLNESYLAGDIVIHNQTIYLSLGSQAANSGFLPEENPRYWRILSLFNDIPCSIYKCLEDITVDAPFSALSSGSVGDEYIENNYYYICSRVDNWARVPMVPFARTGGTRGDKAVDSNYYYVALSDGNWGGILLHDSNKAVVGDETILDTVYETNFVHVYTSNGWKKFLIAPWNFNGFVPFLDAGKWESQTPKNSDHFEKYIQAYSLGATDWSDQQNYEVGSLASYSNDIWSATDFSGPNNEAAQQPYIGSNYWANTGEGGVDIIANYSIGDLVYHQDSVYKALADNPVGAPIIASLGSGAAINSDYINSEWMPFWQLNTSYEDFVYDHHGIPESGKRSIGIEIGIIDNTGGVLNSQRLIGVNQEPSILPNGFQVDSISETTKVKFNFNYAFSSQEKTTKVNLYRIGAGEVDVLDSNGDVVYRDFSKFEITGADNLPYSLTGGDSTLSKITFGASDATFGENINEIIDSPPIPKIDNVDQITGYYYKILPFDDFGSGDVFGVNDNQGDLERVLVYPKNYSNQDPNGLPGPVYRTSKDDIPEPIINFSGDTAFENYFLSWLHPQGQVQNSSNIPNDLSHYEVWMSAYKKLELGSLNLFLKDEADPGEALDFSNNSGYKMIETDVESTGPIPIELQDPASGIINAEKIFDISAGAPEIETSYFGKTNDTRYFWVRSVDFAGNKSPFTGSQITGPEIEGLELTLGQATATDISDFELNMTEVFGNTIALAPNSDPFIVAGAANAVSWPPHVLYYQGTGYAIEGSGVGAGFAGVDAGYIWWSPRDIGLFDVDQYQFDGLSNIYYSGIDYRSSLNHPAGSDGVDPDEDFQDGDFIVARIAGYPNNVQATPVFHAFANALIGTANIAEAAIVNAKINDLKADKITAGLIKGQDIRITQLAGTQGGIRTEGFHGIDHTSPNLSGFLLSGDGSFAFQAGNSSLGLDSDGTLSLRGIIKQSSGDDYDFIDVSATPGNFNYVETENGYEYEPLEDVTIDVEFRNTSIIDKDNILIKAFGVDDSGNEYDISNGNGVSDDWVSLGDVESTFNIDHSSSAEVFKYTAFSSSSTTANAQLELSSEGFNSALTFNPNKVGESVVVYIKSTKSDFQKKISIGRIIDGKIGNPGPGTTYKGDWVAGTQYVAQYEGGDVLRPTRGDVVKYGSSQYYICTQTHNDGSVLPTNASYWKEFGANFESVATNLLLTDKAYITDGLVMGEANEAGYIVSNGFKPGVSYNPLGTAGDSYATPGFLLARDNSNPAKVYFDIGGPLYNDPTNGVISKISYDSFDGKIKIQGSQFDGSINIQNNHGPTDFTGYYDDDNFASFVGGGYNNTIGQIIIDAISYDSVGCSIVGGAENDISAAFSSIVGGFDNDCNDNFSVIAGGHKNEMSGDIDENGGNFIGAGQNNKIAGGSNQSILAGDSNEISYDPPNKYYYGRFGPYVYSDDNYLIGGFAFGIGEEWDHQKVYDQGDIVYCSSLGSDYVYGTYNQYWLFKRNAVSPSSNIQPDVNAVEGVQYTTLYRWDKISRNVIASPGYNSTVSTNLKWILYSWIGSLYLSSNNSSQSPIDVFDGRYPISRNIGWCYLVLNSTTSEWGFVVVDVSSTKQDPVIWIYFDSIIAKDINSNTVTLTKKWCLFGYSRYSSSTADFFVNGVGFHTLV